MKLAGCFNGTTTYCTSKAQGKWDFSCHDPFKCSSRSLGVKVRAEKISQMSQ